MKAIKVEHNHEQGTDFAVCRDEWEFAQHFKHRYMLNKGETEALRKCYNILLGCRCTPIEWPPKSEEVLS